MNPELSFLAFAGLGVGFFVLLWFVATHNRLIRLRNHIQESWSNVDVALQRRHDLIPNLVNTVKGFMAHETATLERLVQLRNQVAGQSGHSDARREAEMQLGSALGTVLARVEAYPDLKSSAAFLDLQQELANTEDRIAAARRFFNANVREYNSAVESFPSSIVAGMQNAKLEEYFELSQLDVRNPVSVQI